MPAKFTTYHLSSTAYDILQQTEDASRVIERAVTPMEIEGAYALLSRVRRMYAEYVQALEQLARSAGAQGLEPEITLRYE